MPGASKVQVLNKPEMLDVVRQEGFDPVRRGSIYFILCPFHADKNPSLALYDYHYYCFGCHDAKGDSINFIQKLRDLSFPETLAYLGIQPEYKLSPQKKTQLRKEQEKRKKRQSLSELYLNWERNYVDELSILLRVLDKVKADFKTMEEAEEFTEIIHQAAIWEYHLELLNSRDEKAKLELFRELHYGR